MPFIFGEKQIKRDPRHRFVDSLNLVHFFKFSFREGRSFDNVSFFNSKCLTFLYLLNNFFNRTKEHRLKTSNYRTHIALLINLFFSLIELKTYENDLFKKIFMNGCF